MPSQCPKPILPKALLKRVSTDIASNRESKMMETVSRPISAPWSAFNKKSEIFMDDLKLKMVDLDPIEVARQLTLIEFELFNAIKVQFLVVIYMFIQSALADV